MHCFSKERESYSHVGKLIANTTYHGLGPVIGIQWLFGVDRDVGKRKQELLHCGGRRAASDEPHFANKGHLV